MRALLPTLLLACSGGTKAPAWDAPGDDGGTGTADGDDSGGGDDGGSDSGSDSGDDAGDDLPTTDSCDETNAFGTVYDGMIATWTAQDDLAPWPEQPLVFVGSSSIRRWEGLALAYQDHTPLQRGFGGAQMAEVALRSEDLVSRHDPAGVVVFAGTNDVAAGVDVDTVVDRVRCLREKLWTAHGRELPVLFIGITPTPSRWATWEQANAVNEAVAAMAEDDPGLVYVDVPTAFLATGSPPDEDLFVSDMLHLSDEGYALWDSVLRPAVDAALSAKDPATSDGRGLEAGTRVLVDFGANDTTNGEHSDAPDYLGQHWNNWHGLVGGATVYPGEHQDDLVTSTGEATDIDLVITGGFSNNGRENGGLLWPDTELLGDLAVGTATQDYFYAVTDDATGGFFLRGLDPDATYTLRFFASRDDPETRVTTYVVHGRSEQSASLQTSGSGAGSAGTGNDDDVAELTGVSPDAWGQVFVDVQLTQGSYAYLALLELEVE